MSVEDILAAESELTHLLGGQQAVVLSTRIRLARNLEGLPFPGWAKPPQRKETSDRCVAALEVLPKFRRGHVVRMGELGVHSFPTRRSSDLGRASCRERV